MMKNVYMAMTKALVGISAGLMLSYSIVDPSSVNVSKPRPMVVSTRKEHTVSASSLDTLTLDLNRYYSASPDGVLVAPSARGVYHKRLCDADTVYLNR